MKLLHVITFRLSILKALVMALWAVFFYFAIIEEINDETDDSLKDYAETIITRYLSGEQLPASYNEAGNQFYLHEVSDRYAATHLHVRYKDMEAYIKDRNEYEPARTITYIFNTEDNRFMEIVVFTPTIDKKDLKEAIFYWLIVLYVGMLVGIVLLNFWTVRRTMRPLRTILNWLDSYNLGQKNKPLKNATNISEFQKLNDTIKRNTKRNEALFEQQKLFIANASHEMQTPLAVCQSRLEMLLDDDKLTESQMEDIIKTMRTLSNLSTTNKSLLLLCKIDNGQFSNSIPIDISNVINRILPDLKSVYAYKHISVDVDTHHTPVIDMDESLANVLFSNLLKNAFVHNISNGNISITIEKRLVRIENTGCTTALDEKKIFERFYHSANNKSSTGLGLALVKAICGLYELDIRYVFENNRHTFEITKHKNS